MEKVRTYRKYINKNTMALLIVLLFVISLIPVVYVGLFNYATGDDYWYGVHTYRGWKEGGLFSALKGSFLTVADFYENWQGTWFTLFLFTLSPNHFWENGYIITVFLALILLIGSYSYLADFYLVKKMEFSKATTTIIVCILLYLSIQYIPRTTSGIYWFNGIMHYSVPFFLGVVAIIHSHKFIENKKKKDYIILLLAFLLLGGGSYLAPLAASLAVSLILISQIEIKELNLKDRKFEIKYDWRNLWILPAFAVELIGIAISFLAPGNSVRGGEEFGFSLKWGLECIIYAIDRGIYLGEDYFIKNGVTTVSYVILSVIIWYEMWEVDYSKFKFKMPFLWVIYMNGIYWAIYTPEIYSRSDVSGGVPNTYFHVFLIITLINIIYVHGWLQRFCLQYWEKNDKNKNKSLLYGKKYKKIIMIPTVISCILLFINISCFDDIRTTSDYCVEYIKSGRLERYKEVREQQHKILSDEPIEEAVIPEMMADYPLLHMYLSEDITEPRNIDRAKYYNKKSVKAVMVE